MSRQNSGAAYSLMAVLFTVLLFIIAWKLILPGYASNKAMISRLDTEINQANSKKDQLDSARSNLAGVENAYQAITVSVSEDADEPNLISELEALALKNNLVLPNISISSSDMAQVATDAAGNPLEIADGPTGQAIAIGISVTGTYDQIGAFVTSLEKSVKFMDIKSLNYSDGEGDTINLSLSLNAYSRLVPSTTVAQ